jgi:hypothetical protein
LFTNAEIAERLRTSRKEAPHNRPDDWIFGKPTAGGNPTVTWIAFPICSDRGAEFMTIPHTDRFRGPISFKSEPGQVKRRIGILFLVVPQAVPSRTAGGGFFPFPATIRARRGCPFFRPRRLCGGCHPSHSRTPRAGEEPLLARSGPLVGLVFPRAVSPV